VSSSTWLSLVATEGVEISSGFAATGIPYRSSSIAVAMPHASGVHPAVTAAPPRTVANPHTTAFTLAAGPRRALARRLLALVADPPGRMAPSTC
jgi:hypothetical protein